MRCPQAWRNWASVSSPSFYQTGRLDWKRSLGNPNFDPRLRASRTGQRKPHDEPAVGRVRGGHRPAVSFRDLADDRQAEP
jgi:hypothetical protein